MAIKDYLKNTIPEFQQGSPELDSFLDASGEFLGDISEAIEHFDYHRDYEKGTIYNVENSLLSLGLDPPRALPIETKRLLLRDLQETILKNGTEDGLVHALRMIGFNAEIRRGWIPSVKCLRKGFIRDPITGEGRRYDVDKFAYVELVYGEEVVTEDGVFFSGYTYQDTFKENPIELLPIMGETYKEFKESNIAVGKTPYVIVRFDEGDFNIAVEKYTSPETGEEYYYSSDEEFRLVNEVIDYFIKGQLRPTTLRVIIIVSLQPFEDEMTFTDDYEDNHTYHPDGGDVLGDSNNITDAYNSSSEVRVVDTTIGSPFLVGSPSPYVSQFSVIPPPDIGEVGCDDSLPPVVDGDGNVIPCVGYVVREFNQWSEFEHEFYITYDRAYPLIPVRANTVIETKSPSDKTMKVYTGVDTVGGVVETLLDEISADEDFVFNTGTDIHYIRFESESLETIPVTFKFNSRN